MRLKFLSLLCVVPLVACSEGTEETPITDVDTGTAIVDTGTAPVDTGSEPVDSTVTDTGTTPTDTGTAPTDTGTAPTDTGADTAPKPDASSDADATAAPTCTDSIKNGGETDVDCGGPTCGKCAVDKACAGATDCTTGICTGGKCVNPSCTDGIKNGSETDTDCGGATCPKCADTKTCAGAGDCSSGVCTATKCVAATCIDTVKNGVETDVDCGGGTCGKCVDGKTCSAATDCVSGLCTANKCVGASCTDMAKNGTETDVDCGGGACGGCDIGKNCLVPTDCASNLCAGGKCVASCTDKVKNGSETDVDCGGTCTPCLPAQKCLIDQDCLGTICGTVSKTCDYATTCSQLHLVRPTLGSGVYTIDPDGAGGVAPFAVYCDMSTGGGGWTLAIKANGGLPTFSYDAALWTNASTLNPASPDFNETEAKLATFSTVPFSSIMIVLRDPPGSGATRMLTLPLASTSLQTLIGTTNAYMATAAGRDAWKGLLQTASLQPYCNREGVNAQGNTFGGIWPSVRLGIVSNQENQCDSPDSWIGVGGRGTACGINPAISVGNSARCSADNGDLDRAAFGYVFVR
jgi:hypothetical protein